MAPSNKPVGTARNVGDVVSRLGRLVQDRIGEFAVEAREELRTSLQHAREDLDEELASRRKPEGATEPDGKAE